MSKQFAKYIKLLQVLFLLPICTFALKGHKKDFKQKIVLNDSIRQLAPGKFVQLSDGYVHYELSGNDTGKVVVFIHGLVAPYYVWDKTVTGMNEEDFKILRFDLYGRGFSDRPELQYDETTYYQELCELLDTLHIQDKINLVGVSMGCLIALNFADKQPERVDKICLIDPGGCNLSKPRLVLAGLNIPGISKRMRSIGGPLFAKTTCNRNFFNNKAGKEAKTLFVSQLKYKGYMNAIMSTIKNFNLYDQRDLMRELAYKADNIMLIWGKKDRIAPYRKSKQVKKCLPEASFYTIKKAGHTPQYEKADVVNPLLIQFLKN